jgi:hypothetical protein
MFAIQEEGTALGFKEFKKNSALLFEGLVSYNEIR